MTFSFFPRKKIKWSWIIENIYKKKKCGLYRSRLTPNCINLLSIPTLDLPSIQDLIRIPLCKWSNESCCWLISETRIKKRNKKGWNHEWLLMSVQSSNSRWVCMWQRNVNVSFLWKRLHFCFSFHKEFSHLDEFFIENIKIYAKNGRKGNRSMWV